MGILDKKKKDKKKAEKKVEKKTQMEKVVDAIDYEPRIKAIEDSVFELSQLVNDAVSKLVKEKAHLLESVPEPVIDEQEAEASAENDVPGIDKAKMLKLLKGADGDTIPVLKEIIKVLK